MALLACSPAKEDGPAEAMGRGTAGGRAVAEEGTLLPAPARPAPRLKGGSVTVYNLLGGVRPATARWGHKGFAVLHPRAPWWDDEAIQTEHSPAVAAMVITGRLSQATGHRQPHGSC